MWPKAIAQLVEFLPHAVRLLPHAEKFFQSKAATDDSAQRAMDAMAEGLRGDLGQVTASHAGLYRQLNEQSAQLADIASGVNASRASLDAAQARIGTLEQRLDRIATLLLVVTLLAVVLVGLVATLLFRAH